MPGPDQRYPLTFAHIMKTGGQTFLAILRRNFGRRHCDMLLKEDAIPRDWKWARFCYPRALSISGHSITPYNEDFPRVFPEARLYTMLRDPLKRAVSHYQFRHQSGDRLPDFPEWVDQYRNYQVRRLCGEENADKAIEVLEGRIGFTGLVERYDESLVLWRRWTGLPELDLAYVPVNRARSNEIRDRIDADDLSREVLEECHVEDRKLYDHVRDVLFPKQLETFTGNLGEELAELETRKAGFDGSENWNSRLGRLHRNAVYRVGLRKIAKNPKVKG